MNDDFLKTLEGLNKAQREAVFYDNGPLLIVAGAGTGKTKVITSRILNLINGDGNSGEPKAKPSEILALTFTEKAAQEMTERVDMYMPLSHEEIWIKTFHGFAEKILKEKALEIGLKPDYKVHAKLDQWIFFKKHLFEFGLEQFLSLSSPDQNISLLLEHFNRIKEEFISPEEYIAYAEKNLKAIKEKESLSSQKEISEKTVLGVEIKEAEKVLEAANAYKKYENLMRSENALDFGDLSYFVLKLFTEKPEVLKEYREKFKYIMVDEFQDTNYAQFKLLMLLCGGGATASNVVVVGDDDQSIFRWRGASLSNILQFGKEFPEAKKIILTENYRSNQNILDASHFFIKFNDPDRLEFKENISKSLKSQRDEILPIEKLEFGNYLEETEFVVGKIKEMFEAGVSLKDIAILVRSNANTIPFAERLEREDIPFQIRSPKGLLSLPEIKNIVSIARAVADNKDDIAFFRLLNLEIFKIESEEISNLLKRAKDEEKSIYEILNLSIKNDGNDVLPGLESDTSKFMGIFNKTLEFSTIHTGGETINFFLNSSEYLKDLSENFTRENEKKIENITAFSKVVKEFEDASEDKSIKAFNEFLKIVEDSGLPITEKEEFASEMDAVQILTAHGAKGLEFETVFVVNLVDSRFPITFRKDSLKVPDELTKEIFPEGDFHIEEERRLFYVALTRAKRKLFLTYSQKYEGNKKWERSQFLEEIGESGLITIAGGKIGEESSEDKDLKEDLKTVNFKKIPTAWENYKSFSFSKIDSFNTCPLKFAYRYVLDLSEPKHHLFSFGSCLHDTLRDFYMIIKNSTFGAVAGSVADGVSPNFDILKDLYEKNWSSNGFGSKEHEEKRKEQGLKILKEFYEKNSNPWVVPAFIEKPFNLKIGEYTLNGRIDRIDKLLDETFEIIDYKTAKTKALDKDYKLQLHVYALACREVLKIPVSKLSVYFLEDNNKVSLTKGIDNLDSVKEDVLYYLKQMKESKFHPTPGRHCSYCSFRVICPAV